ADVLLDAPGDGLLDVLGPQSRRQRADHQHRRRQLREGVDAHARRDHGREHHQRDAGHQDRDRVAERALGHGAPRAATPPADAGAAGVVLALVAPASPSRSSDRPSVTTSAPAASAGSTNSSPPRSPTTASVRLAACPFATTNTAARAPRTVAAVSGMAAAGAG